MKKEIFFTKTNSEGEIVFISNKEEITDRHLKILKDLVEGNLISELIRPISYTSNFGNPTYTFAFDFHNTLSEALNEELMNVEKKRMKRDIFEDIKDIIKWDGEDKVLPILFNDYDEQYHKIIHDLYEIYKEEIKSNK